MYFNALPKLIYDFPNIKGENKNLQQIIDITSSIRFRQDFINSLKVFDVYIIKDNETIENIAEKLYGNAAYHWILMLFNDKYDYIEDFPLNAVTFDKFIERKYKSRGHAIKHFVNNSNHIINPNGFITLKATSLNGLADNIDVLNSNNGRLIIKKDTDIGQTIAKINPLSSSLEVSDEITVSFFYHKNTFIEGDIVILYRQLFDGTEDTITTAIVNKIEMPEFIRAVSNYEWEYSKNEEKRYLKIIPKNYLDQIIQNFNVLY